MTNFEEAAARLLRACALDIREGGVIIAVDEISGFVCDRVRSFAQYPADQDVVVAIAADTWLDAEGDSDAFDYADQQADVVNALAIDLAPALAEALGWL